MKLPSLEEAKDKFPIGTIFNNKNFGLKCDDILVTGDDFYYSGGDILVRHNSCKKKGKYTGSSYTIFRNGRWADIDFLSGYNLDNKEPIYEIY